MVTPIILLRYNGHVDMIVIFTKKEINTIKPKNTNISGATSETEVTSPVIPEDLQKSYPQKRISIAIIMVPIEKKWLSLRRFKMTDKSITKKRGAIINLFCIIGVIILIINSLASDKSDDEVNSYLSVFIE
uniref:Uncharacterized protein n=1 Tax=Rhizophagus irregularis (strain DAOM 181602 / DAOM 197198 / MUCL 43194) TaxID=747089 RepID=U9TT53_RHIID